MGSRAWEMPCGSSSRQASDCGWAGVSRAPGGGVAALGGAQQAFSRGTNTQTRNVHAPACYTHPTQPTHLLHRLVVAQLLVAVAVHDAPNDVDCRWVQLAKLVVAVGSQVDQLVLGDSLNCEVLQIGLHIKG